MQGQEKLQVPSTHLCILRCLSIISVGPVHQLHLRVTAPLPPSHILCLCKEGPRTPKRQWFPKEKKKIEAKYTIHTSLTSGKIL